MATTLDDDTINLIQEHSRLLLERPTAPVTKRRKEIEYVLRRRRGTFADNDDERLVRSIVAELRAKQPPLTEEQNNLARQAVLDLAESRLERGATR